MRRKDRFSFVPPVFVIVFLVSFRLYAQTDPVAEVNRGVELVEAGKLREAITVWHTVLDDLTPKHRHAVHLYLGLAYNELGQNPETWHYLSTYLKNNDQEDLLTGKDLQDVEATLIKAGYLKSAITCDPENARIIGLTDQADSAYQCPLAWWMKPGKHTVTVALDGFVTAEHELDVVQRGGGNLFTVKLEKLPDTGPSLPVTPVGPDGPALDGRNPNRFWQWSIIGGGLAMVAAGGICTAVGYSNNESLYDKYPPETPSNKSKYDAAYTDEVQPPRVASWVLYGVGAATALSGAIWLFSDLGDRGGDQTSWQMVPMLVPDAVGAMGAWTF
jgi:hypothetical protein